MGYSINNVEKIDSEVKNLDTHFLYIFQNNLEI